MGSGMVVIGLAGLIIGEVLLGKGGRHTMLRGVAAALVGAVLYRIIIAVALSSNLGATNLKLVSAIIVAAAIAWPTVLGKVRFYRQRKKRRG
jgi:putative ABC transport system permease protein